MGGAVEGRYVVRVVNRSHTINLECNTDDREVAEQYARTAIADNCRNATVILFIGGSTVSWWNKVELLRYQSAHPDWKPG